MTRSININGYETSDAWVLTEPTEVENPEPKLFTVDVTGRDGVIDFTDFMGGVKYENRAISIVLVCDSPDWRNEYQAIKRLCHGKMVSIHHPDYEGVFTGRGNVQLSEYTSRYGVVAIEFDCQPYRFLHEITYKANCAGGVWLTLPCGDKEQIPTFDCEWPITVVYDGVQYELPAGSNRILDLQLKQGDNDVYIDSYLEAGNTTWGDLQSFTYEELSQHSYSWWRWQDEPPQHRATYSDIDEYTYEELGGKTYQEWYWSNTEGIVRDVYIQYDMEEL